jgi:DNA-binding MarR family transcriptional regulator
VTTHVSGTAADSISLDQIMRIAAFRWQLRAFLRHSEEVARGWGLTPQRYLLLLTIKGSPGGTERISIGEVADRLSLSRNTVTETCTRAEQAGLIRREAGEDDRRVVYLRLTAEGERRLCGAVLAIEQHREAIADAFDELTASFDKQVTQEAGFASHKLALPWVLHGWAIEFTPRTFTKPSKGREYMRALTVHARNRESAQKLRSALAEFNPELIEADNGYQVSVELGSFDGQVLAVLAVLEAYVIDRDDGPATVELDGRRYSMHGQ